jgi:hypothetical protein
MRRRVENENQSPPTNFEKRKKELEKWKKNGWLDKIKTVFASTLVLF